MELRSLGNTGIRVSAVGLGTVRFGRSEGLKYPRPVAVLSDDEAAILLAQAEDAGINLLDTAPAYGAAEERLGRLLAGRRDRWVISTKAGEAFDARGSAFDFTPEAVLRSLDRSLLRLGADHVDVLLIHSDGLIELDLESSGLLDAMGRAKAEGKARACGVSTKTPEGAVLAARLCDVVMLTLNPLHRADAPAVEVARGRGAGVLVKKALASGHVDRLPRPAGQDPAVAALVAALTTPGVSSVVVGASTPAHLTAAAQAAALAAGAQHSRTTTTPRATTP